MKPWPLADTISAAIIRPHEGEALVPAWTDLAHRAIEPNGFFGPGPTLAAFRHLPEGRGARLLVAWRGEGETRRLVGLLPLAKARGRYLNPLPIWRAAACYGTVSTPLVDPDRPAETISAMLTALRAAGTHALLLPYLPEDGPVADALREAGRLDARPVLAFAGHGRAFLQSPLAGAEYVRATLEPRRRKEADRQRRRLAELGRLETAIATGADLAADLDAFLALEAAGWKGRAGTALSLSAGGTDFVRDLVERGARDGSVRIATLRLDGRVIAAGLVLIGGRRAFYAKTSYDEDLARFSPGLLLTLDLTAHLLDDPTIDDADSIAVADHPMIDRIWTGRLAIATTLAATRRDGGVAFRMAAGFERMREDAVALAKQRITQFRASRKAVAKHEAGKAAAPPSP